MTELSLFFLFFLSFFFFFLIAAPNAVVRALAEAITDHMPESSKTRLVSLCKTRWVARHDSLSSLEKLYKTVDVTLRSIAENENGTWSPKHITSANGLLTRIESFRFLFAFVVTKKALAHVKSLTAVLTVILRWFGTVLGQNVPIFFVKTYCLWHKQLENEIILGGHRAPFFRKWVRTLLFSTFLSME